MRRAPRCDPAPPRSAMWIRDGETACLVPHRSPERLAEAILTAYDAREPIGAAARRTVEESYDRDVTMARLAAVLHDAAARRRAR